MLHKRDRRVVDDAPQADHQRAGAGVQDPPAKPDQLVAGSHVRAASFAGAQGHQLVAKILLQQVVGIQLPVGELDVRQVGLVEPVFAMRGDM